MTTKSNATHGDKNNKNNLFTNKLIKKGLNDFELIGDYNSEVVTLYHKECENSFTINPSAFFKKKEKCEHCTQIKLNEEFQKFLDEKFNNEFNRVGDYKTDKTKVKIKHLNCGAIIDRTPDSLKRMKNANILCECSKNKNKNNDEVIYKNNLKFANKLIKKGLSDFELVGDYNSKLITLYHKKCGGSFVVNPDKFFRRKEKCDCSVQIKLNEEFQKFLDEKFNNEFKLVSNYKTTRAKVSITHINCGAIIEKTPEALKKIENINTLCKCTKRQTCLDNKELVRKNNLIFDNRLIKEGLIDFKRKSDYTTYYDEIKLYHIKCRKEFTVTPYNFFKRKNKCECCSKSMRGRVSTQKNDFYQNKIDKLTNKEFLLLSDYYNLNSYIELKHLVCGHKFEVRADNFESSKNRCPKCAKRHDANETASQKVKRIEKILNNEFEILTKYFTWRDSVKLRHKKCGNEFECKASSLPNGKSKNNSKIKCEVCLSEERREDFLDRLNRVQNANFMLKGKYNGMNELAIFYHTGCRNTFAVTASYMLRKPLKDCPKCREEKKK